MRRLSLLLTVLTIAAAYPSALAQSKPNFSGIWVGISPSEAVGHQTELRHTPTTLSFVNVSDGRIETFALDGKERISESTVANNEKVITATTYSWVGDKVVGTRVTTSPLRRTVELKQIFSLDAAGRLVIEISQVEANLRSQSKTVVSIRKTAK